MYLLIDLVALGSWVNVKLYFCFNFNANFGNVTKSQGIALSKYQVGDYFGCVCDITKLNESFNHNAN